MLSYLIIKMKTILGLSIFCFGILIVSVKGDPCNNYKVLDSADDFKRSAANSKTTSLCDNMLESGWYRIISKAGERMPTKCIEGGFRCGTISSIWMNGTYPVTNETKSVTACAANYNGNCCAYSHQMKVKNCTSYLVYSLVPVAPCYQAYCFGSELPCPNGETSNNGFSPGCEPDPCESSNHGVLQGEVKRSSNYTLTANDVAIEDSRLRTGWYRIDSVTGNDIANYSVPMMQCGTLYPLWMKGSIPDGRERDTTVNRKVCRSGLTDTCVKEYDIKVRNCGNYRTYYLAQLDVDKSAYCFGTLPLPQPTTLTTTTRSTTTTKTTTATKPKTTTKPTTTTPRSTTTFKTVWTTKTKPVASIITNKGDISTSSSLNKHTTSHLHHKGKEEESADIMVIVAVLIVLVVILLVVIVTIVMLFRMKPQCLSPPPPPTYEDIVKTDKNTFNPYAQIGETNNYSSITEIKDNMHNEGYDEIPYDKNQTIQENKLYLQNFAIMPDSNQIVHENMMYLQIPITVPLDKSEKPEIFQ